MQRNQTPRQQTTNNISRTRQHTTTTNNTFSMTPPRRLRITSRHQSTPRPNQISTNTIKVNNTNALSRLNRARQYPIISSRITRIHRIRPHSRHLLSLLPRPHSRIIRSHSVDLGPQLRRHLSHNSRRTRSNLFQTTRTNAITTNRERMSLLLRRSIIRRTSHLLRIISTRRIINNTQRITPRVPTPTRYISQFNNLQRLFRHPINTSHSTLTTTLTNIQISHSTRRTSTTKLPNLTPNIRNQNRHPLRITRNFLRPHRFNHRFHTFINISSNTRILLSHFQSRTANNNTNTNNITRPTRPHLSHTSRTQRLTEIIPNLSRTHRHNTRSLTKTIRRTQSNNIQTRHPTTTTYNTILKRPTQVHTTSTNRITMRHNQNQRRTRHRRQVNRIIITRPTHMRTTNINPRTLSIKRQHTTH